jgi:hypothetical protein
VRAFRIGASGEERALNRLGLVVICLVMLLAGRAGPWSVRYLQTKRVIGHSSTRRSLALEETTGSGLRQWCAPAPARTTHRMKIVDGVK